MKSVLQRSPNQKFLPLCSGIIILITPIWNFGDHLRRTYDMQETWEFHVIWIIAASHIGLTIWFQKASPIRTERL